MLVTLHLRLSLRTQIFVVAFSVVRMQRPISRLNVIGIVLVAMGAVRYAFVSARERRLREKRAEKNSSGSGKKKADANSDGSTGPLLPTAAVVPAGLMVNGKGALKKGKAEREGRAAKKTRGLAWGGWWGGRNGDVSHRSS